ncbi:MAG: hypothetical protein HQ568_03160, partial [Calditrichaeota bacterium]|nr:hypothetical protein [Calditrichota bacterium]
MRKLPALHKLSLIVMIFISCTLTAAENPSSEWLSINGNNGEDVSVSFVTPTVELVNLEFDGQSFSQIDVTSDAVIGQIGGPVLPGWSRWIELPTGMKPVLTMQVGNCETITDVKIAPFPISDFNNQDATSIIKTNPVDYSSKELLPAQPATISDPISIGGTRFTVLTISPYQYNPNKEELHVYENLNVDISFENDPTAEASPDRQMAPAMDELVRSLSDLPPRRDDGNLHQDNLGGYVIVTPDDDDIIEAIEPLAEWKRRKGFVVTMLNIDDVNGRVGLREYLINAGHNWDIPPTFVLLAGDGNGRYDIPFYDDGQQGAWVGWHISDNQFVIWDYENPEGARPEEWIPNAFIGRLPAERIEHMEYMVAKILAYEIEPYTDEPWVEGAQLIAQGVRSCIHANVAVRELMQGFGYERDNL